MKSNTKTRSRLLSLSAFALLGGVMLGTTSCGKFGEKVGDPFFTVKNGDLEVTFCDKGASIYSIKFNDEYMTYHPKNKATFLRDDYYYGKVLGRVAGRIKDGKLNIDGDEYQLEVNETSGKKNNSLHGGTHSLSTKYFDRSIYNDEKTGYTNVMFHYLSPDGEAGYPGTLDTYIRYVIGNNRVGVVINATPDRLAPVDVSIHPFFRLGNEGTILDHTLTINNCTRYAQYSEDEDQTVVGLTSTSGTPYDFSTETPIKNNIYEAKKIDPVSGGFDNIWYFDGNLNVVLKNNNTSLTVTSATKTTNAVIMYSNCYPHEQDEMNPSGKDALYAGISIEPYTFFTRDGIDTIFHSISDPFKSAITYIFSSTK